MSGLHTFRRLTEQSAIAILIAACAPSAVAPPVPKVCAVDSMRARLARYQGNFPVPVVLADSLDVRVQRTSPFETDVPRPPGFRRGYAADIYLAVVIDTSGRVALAQAISDDVRATTARRPPTPEILAGFEQAALDEVGALAYTKPRFHGQPVMALACMGPFSFVER